MDIGKVFNATNIGFASAGFLGTMTAAGAAMGVAESNADQQYNSPKDSAIMGAAVGAGVLGTGAVIGGTGYMLAKDDFKYGKKAAKAGGWLGKKGLEFTGNVSIGMANGAARGVMDTTLGVGDAISKAFLKVDKERPNMLGGVRLTKAGKAAVGLLALGSLVNDARKSYDESRMGTPTGMVTSTPTIDYAGPEQYGAGGDLVFALNQNRRG